MSSIALEGLQEDQYRYGNYQAIRYDKTNTDFFPVGYLAKLYNLCRQSGRRGGDGILTAIFGGNPASDFDSIVSYLAARVVIVLGEWQEDGTFREGGFAFPIIMCGVKAPEVSMFAGYGMFRHVWGQPGEPVMAMLGLAYLFQEFGLKAIHGTRRIENRLTARFMTPFGFKEVGTIPEYQLKDGVLVPAVITTLLRADFEAYVENFLVAEYRAAKAAEPVAEVKLTITEAPEVTPPVVASGVLSWL